MGYTAVAPMPPAIACQEKSIATQRYTYSEGHETYPKIKVLHEILNRYIDSRPKRHFRYDLLQYTLIGRGG